MAGCSILELVRGDFGISIRPLGLDSHSCLSESLAELISAVFQLDFGSDIDYLHVSSLLKDCLKAADAAPKPVKRKSDETAAAEPSHPVAPKAATAPKAVAAARVVKHQSDEEDEPVAAKVAGWSNAPPPLTFPGDAEVHQTNAQDSAQGMHSLR